MSQLNAGGTDWLDSTINSIRLDLGENSGSDIFDIDWITVEEPDGTSAVGQSLTLDDGLQTAVMVSLFTDHRAEADDVIPDGTENRRGYWADAWPDIEGDLIGSRLWLLSREKQTQETLNRAREYAEEALQWLIDDGIAQSVSVTTEIVRTGVLGLLVEILRPSGELSEYRFNNLWEAT
ncbi:MAG: phage GP46 family protein [Gammaproteobacteria bacterium]|nr:phage GP46 family protein [Gammaproteobacteria bacterium]